MAIKAPAKRPVDFAPHCVACPRLARLLAAVRETHPHYHARPVPSFGDTHPRLLVVGLAPGMHGANRTGRPFTGDHAGIMLYEPKNRSWLYVRCVKSGAVCAVSQSNPVT